jgi:hypothetical protein
MTRQLWLHVGAPKSGTTYLQQILEANRTTLADHGVLVVGARHLDRVHAAMVVREDPRLDDLGPRARSSWQRLVAEIRGWAGDRAILSYELFAGASAEQVRRALADLDGIEVHVVITARDYARAVPSAWQERLKFALTTPLEDWRPRPDSAGPRAEWSWRTMDAASVAARWGETLPPDHVHVVTVPGAGAAKGELWRRFADACTLADLELRLDVPRANESLGVVATELLRRVNQKLGDRMPSSRDQAVWLRDTLAHRVLVHLGREPIGITDAQFAEAGERAGQGIAGLSAAGYAVHGDLEDLRATRPAGRTPGEVTEKELLDAATTTIAELLLELKQRTDTERPGPGAPEPRPARSRVATAGRRVLQRLASVEVGREAAALERRLDALEAQLQDQRALQLRVAELTDVVTELLLPDGDPDLERIERYREESL